MTVTPAPLDEPHISVVVPTFRRPRALRAAVGALLAQDYPSERLELIVVDDEGQGQARSALANLDNGGILITHQSQNGGGAARARNRGAQLAQGDILLFVDDDIIVAEDHLRLHLRALTETGRALVNGTWRFSPEVLTRLQSSPFGRFRVDLEQRFQDEARQGDANGGLVDMQLLGSWNLSLTRELFVEIGGFDEAFPVAGAEDQDFSLRARQAGCRLVLDSRIVCLHNDNRLDLLSYCEREERSARTMPVIARKFPGQYGASRYIIENRPISPGDTGTVVAKKLVKATLANRLALGLLHRLIKLAEASPMPESALRRAYSGMLGLYLYRGFRQSWRAS